MHFPKALLLFALLIGGTTPALAGSVLDHVKAEGVLRCGGAERPGLISIDDQGHASGLELDICRALASLVLGPTGRLEFHRYDSVKDYDGVRDGTDEVAFLTGAEILDQNLAGKLVPGPAIFYETTAVMVDESSPVQHLAELAGQSICFPLGSNAQRHLEAWFAAHHLDFIRQGFQEDVEMLDAYNVQYCRGMAGETTTLAAMRLNGGIRHLKSRILPEPLAAFPVLATTGTQDAQWAAIVAWTIHTLVRAETPQAAWAAGGVDSLPLTAVPELGLEKGWQQRLVGLVGTYGDLYRRNLGADSPLALPRGLNAPWEDGGLMLAPYAD
jgi:general L-amino acid transport system substrate-binding protein